MESMDPTIIVAIPVPGWICSIDPITEQGQTGFICHAPHEWMEIAAYYVWLDNERKHVPPQDNQTFDNWMKGEFQLYDGVE